MGIIDKADGSAYVEQGNTKALATVHGPHEATYKSKAVHDRAILNTQYSVATFATSERKSRIRDRRSLEISRMIREVFERAVMTELAPRSQIDIYVQVLQSDGGNLCASINAAALALIDAGIAMRDFVCACTASCIDETPIVDINYLEENARGPDFSLAIFPRSEKVLLCHMNSRTHIDHLEGITDTAIQGCKDIFAVLNQTVRERTEEQIATISIDAL
ncbi:exosome complex component RRP41-like [Oscarella lobularis]|uniref:exosome complex component RRP41-like n=1 Tax=Oscarella lobularis TaxID=121494 RepID=UPI003314404E